MILTGVNRSTRKKIRPSANLTNKHPKQTSLALNPGLQAGLRSMQLLCRVCNNFIVRICDLFQGSRNILAFT